MSTTIREITPTDYIKMTRLITAPKEHFWVFPSAVFPITEDAIKERAKTRDFIMIEIDGKLVGFANLYEEEKHLYIGNVAIAHAYRGKGYGKKLMVIMRERARAKYGAEELRISVVKENDVAMKLYQGFGFEEYSGEIFKSPMGEYLVFVHMKLAL